MSQKKELDKTDVGDHAADDRRDVVDDDDNASVERFEAAVGNYENPEPSAIVPEGIQ